MERGGSSLFSLVCRSEAMTLAPAATAPNYELNPNRPHAFTDTDLHRAHDSHFTVFTSRLGVRLSKSLISLTLIPRHASSAVHAQLPMSKDWVLEARKCRAVKCRKWRWLVERLENAVHSTSCPSPLSVVRLLIPPPGATIELHSCSFERGKCDLAIIGGSRCTELSYSFDSDCGARDMSSFDWNRLISVL
jgi:hypothetical protein